MPQTERSAQAASLEPSRLSFGGVAGNHVACEKFGETPDGAQPHQPDRLRFIARVDEGLPATARGESASAVGIRKAGRWPSPRPNRKGRMGGSVSSVPLGESLPGLLGHKLKCDGWRVACLLLRWEAGLIIQFRSLSGRWASLFFSSRSVVYIASPLLCQKGYY